MKAYISKKHSTENKNNGRKHIRTRSLTKSCERYLGTLSVNEVSNSETIENGKSVENLFHCEKFFSSKTKTKYTSLTASTVDTLSGSDPDEEINYFSRNQRLRAIFEHEDEYRKSSIHNTPQSKNIMKGKSKPFRNYWQAKFGDEVVNEEKEFSSPTRFKRFTDEVSGTNEDKHYRNFTFLFVSFRLKGLPKSRNQAVIA